MIFKHLNDQPSPDRSPAASRREHSSRGEPGPSYEAKLRAMEKEAEMALPGFDAQFYNRAGDLCVEVERRDRALGYYGQAIDAYMRAGRYNAAGAVGRKLLRISPGSVRVRCTLAWLSIGKGQLSDARWEIDEYVQAAVDAGEVELARKQIRMMSDATYDTELRALLAGHLHKLGDPDGAEQIMGSPPPVQDRREAPDALWSRVLRAALMGPKDLRQNG
jgi:hypothetical protein